MIYNKADLFIENGFRELIPNPKYTSKYDEYEDDNLFIEDDKKEFEG